MTTTTTTTKSTLTFLESIFSETLPMTVMQLTAKKQHLEQAIPYTRTQESAAEYSATTRTNSVHSAATALTTTDRSNDSNARQWNGSYEDDDDRDAMR